MRARSLMSQAISTSRFSPEPSALLFSSPPANLNSHGARQIGHRCARRASHTREIHRLKESTSESGALGSCCRRRLSWDAPNRDAPNQFLVFEKCKPEPGWGRPTTEPLSVAGHTHLVGIALQPLADALQVESVATRPPDNRAVIAGELGTGWAAVERHATDTAHIVARVPCPCGRRVPVLDGDLDRHLEALQRDHTWQRTTLTSAPRPPRTSLATPVSQSRPCALSPRLFLTTRSVLLAAGVRTSCGSREAPYCPAAPAPPSRAIATRARTRAASHV